MKVHFFLLAPALLLAACATPNGSGNDPMAPRPIEELPEAVAAVVAPNQNLSQVRIMPDDGCYWYQWAGPVETTYLPLRTRDGRMICTRPEGEEVAG